MIIKLDIIKFITLHIKYYNFIFSNFLIDFEHDNFVTEKVNKFNLIYQAKFFNL